MNELMEKVENLEKCLDSSSLVLSVQEVLSRVKKDKKLSSLLEEYSLTPREDLKNQILENDLFQEYKIKETELNLFIMELNSKLKKISKKGSCMR